MNMLVKEYRAATHSQTEMAAPKEDDFPLLERLPPYLFAAMEAQKSQLTRQNLMSSDFRLLDFGLGKPDLPADPAVVHELTAGANRIGAHGYAPTDGIPELRVAICDWYERRYRVGLNPETEAVVTIGSKEGISHLALAATRPGDAVFVPDTAYPIHESAFVIAGASVVRIPLVPIEHYEVALARAIKHVSGRGRIVILNFPSNPTGVCVNSDFFEGLVYLAKRHNLWIVHDFAYADFVFDEHCAPSILSVKGSKDVAVEFFTMSKSYNMAGWRVGFMCGNQKLVSALKHAKSYFDYGTFRPIQEAAVVALRDGDSAVLETRKVYAGRRDAIVSCLNHIGWPVNGPAGGMFVWARIPPSHRYMKSREFASLLLHDARVVVSPGIGFGPGGDEHVRFSLVHDEATIGQAVDAIATVLR